jgi:hypothetical protein
MGCRQRLQAEFVQAMSIVDAKRADRQAIISHEMKPGRGETPRTLWARKLWP